MEYHWAKEVYLLKLEEEQGERHHILPKKWDDASSLKDLKPHLCGKVWIAFWLWKKRCPLIQIFFSSSDIYYLFNIISNTQMKSWMWDPIHKELLEEWKDIMTFSYTVFVLIFLTQPLVIELTLLSVEWLIWISLTKMTNNENLQYLALVRQSYWKGWLETWRNHIGKFSVGL